MAEIIGVYILLSDLGLICYLVFFERRNCRLIRESCVLVLNSNVGFSFDINFGEGSLEMQDYECSFVGLQLRIMLI